MSFPIPSMSGVFIYIYHKHQPNVGKYAIHGWCGFLFLRLTIHYQYHLLPWNFASTTSPNSTPPPPKKPIIREPLVTQTPLHEVIHHWQGPYITLRNGQTWNTLQCLDAFILLKRMAGGNSLYWGWSSHPLVGNPYSRYEPPYFLGLWPLPYTMKIMIDGSLDPSTYNSNMHRMKEPKLKFDTPASRTASFLKMAFHQYLRTTVDGWNPASPGMHITL